MNSKEIIIVDDDEEILMLTESILMKYGYTVRGFNDPNEALESFTKDPSPVFLTDLNMPNLRGEDLIKKLSFAEFPPIVLVLTAHGGIDSVIGLMREGVYDYMVKPFTREELISRVEKAFEVATLRRLEKNIEAERKLRTENQLNWNLWKEAIIKKDSDKTEGNLIGNLNSSLIQGAGIGTITTLIQMIEQTAVLKENVYEVEKEIMDMLFENANISNRLTMMLGEIDYVINNPLPKENISLKKMYGILSDIVTSVKPFEILKEHQVKLGYNKAFDNESYKVNINKEYFEMAIKELLINAFKFSVPKSNIYFLFEIVGNNILINILNSSDVHGDLVGITEQYQNIIFEPFFRIAKNVFEKYETLDFGLGLTLVDKVVVNHHGKIRASNLKNYLDNTGQLITAFSIELPLDKT